MDCITVVPTYRLRWDKLTSTFSTEGHLLGWPDDRHPFSIVVSSSKTGESRTFHFVGREYDLKRDCDVLVYEHPGMRFLVIVY